MTPFFNFILMGNWVQSTFIQINWQYCPRPITLLIKAYKYIYWESLLFDFAVEP